MTPERFSQIFDEVTYKCWTTLGNRSHVYSRNNDKLHNFKRAADFEDLPAEDALIGMMTKHVVSVYDYVDDISEGVFHTREEWLEKIIDLINYPILLLALLEDEGNLWAEKVAFDIPEKAIITGVEHAGNSYEA